MTDLFDLASSSTPDRGSMKLDRTEPAVDQKLRPLADRLRPDEISDVVGQDHILGPEGPLGHMLAAGSLGSIIFWGPPGVGKTTIAGLLARVTDLTFVQISAIFTGVADLKKIFEAAKLRFGNGRGTLLFVDEIHRFNKAQQDAFLPLMEKGVIVLVGATTENPSFELNQALLSRAQVMILKRLTREPLEELLSRSEAKLGTPLSLTSGARNALIEAADGDGRMLLNLVEQIAGDTTGPLDEAALSQRISKRSAKYDKSGDGHYNLISALHKSVRGSDVDASLYWFARMLKGGEDPRYLARRITRMAVEDIGLADVRAQGVCLEAWQVYERLGSPEGELALAQAVAYLAMAPKSNAVYVAYKAAAVAASRSGSLPPPNHIVNAPTRWMKDQGFGEGYVYDHDTEEGVSGQNYFPDGMPRETYYQPVGRGAEQGYVELLRSLSARRKDVES